MKSHGYHVHTLQAANKICNHMPGRNYKSFTPAPHEVQYTRAGGNAKDSIIECAVMINQLKRHLKQDGLQPDSLNTFFIIENHHDAGIYYEPALFYNEVADGLETDFTPSGDYMLDCCAADIDKWDNVSLARLRKLEHSCYLPAKVILMTQPKIFINENIHDYG